MFVSSICLCPLNQTIYLFDSSFVLSETVFLGNLFIGNKIIYEL